MVEWDDMTPEERDRLIYLVLSEDALKAIVLIMRKKHGPGVSTDEIMRFAFKVARNRMIPAHLRKKKTVSKSNTPAPERTRSDE
jgi:hypothetical protein